MKDIYVEFKGSDIKGDSRDAKHKDTVEVYSWSHTMRQPKSATASPVPFSPPCYCTARWQQAPR